MRQETPQIFRQSGGTSIAPRRFLPQALERDHFQVARHTHLQAARRHGFVMAQLIQRLQRRLPCARRPARQQLVEDRSQRIDVGRGPIARLSPSACSGAM